MTRVVIVGAGISGLAAAYRLQRLTPEVEITVLEQRDRVGGNAWTDRRDGFQVETGPNGFLDTKPSTIELCRDLGIAERLIPASEGSARNRYLLLDGRLRLLPASPLGLLAGNLLSWRGKFELLMERFRWRRTETSDESIDAFARRRGGREAAELLADAAVTGIHGGDPALLSLPAAFPRLADLEAKYGSVFKGLAAASRRRRAEAAARGEPYRRPGMWSFRDGMRALVEALSERLHRPPCLRINVQSVERTGGPGWVVRGEGQNVRPADVVVLACPAYRQAGLLADLDPELAERLAGIAYNRIAVVAVGYRQADLPRPLDGFGYIAPQRTRRDLLGVQWCSSIFPDRAPPGMVLVRALCGGWHRAEVAGWDDERLVEAVRADLRLALGIRAAPVFRHIVRWDRAIPQYLLGHRERVAWIEQRLSRHPGLFLAGNAYHGVAFNDCTEQSERVAEKVATFFRNAAK
jgi:oxygen-dependent protoporphyrinogen oxidase